MSELKTLLAAARPRFGMTDSWLPEWDKEHRPEQSPQVALLQISEEVLEGQKALLRFVHIEAESVRDLLCQTRLAKRKRGSEISPMPAACRQFFVFFGFLSCKDYSRVTWEHGWAEKTWALPGTAWQLSRDFFPGHSQKSRQCMAILRMSRLGFWNKSDHKKEP